MLDPKWRSDFPLLTAAKPVIYFDNACATLKPESILAAMDEYNRSYPTCGGRSLNHLGEWVTDAVAKARQTVATFINAAAAEEIIFVRNTTEGINLLAHSYPLETGDVILTSDKEHNSNLVPWQLAAARTGAVHKVVRTQADGTFDMAAYQAALAAGGVKLVALGLTSNLDGVSIPAQAVVAAAHAAGATVVLDAAQAAPHQLLDVQALGADFVVFSGHKLCGPSGTGVLYGQADKLAHLRPFITGGSTVSATTYTTHDWLPLPARFEGGTQDYAGIIGLGAAMEYLDIIGLPAIAEHEQALNQYATSRLIDLPGVKILGPAEAASRGGILSFMVEGIDMHQIALTLDSSANVAVRSGQHCVHSWFADRGWPGSVRWSFYLYNTTDEIDVAVASLSDIIKVYR